MKKRLIISSGIANAFEWYDYALFGHLAPIIGQKFFPDNDPNAALLNAFLLFAAGYVMRPLGGLAFGIIGDKLGRRTALSAAVFFMAFPTALIGLIPTYETIGIFAPIIMLIARMLQGLSMGGALTGSVSFLIEHASVRRRGIAGSIPMAGICIGILMGSLTSTFFKSIMTPEEFNEWGWRIPFLLGIFIIYAGIYIKKYTNETPSFKSAKEAGTIEKSPISKAIANHKIDMLISIFINSTGSVLFYIQAIYLINYLKVDRNFLEKDVEWISALSYVFMGFAAIFAGWLSDKIGRVKIYVFNIMLIILTSFWAIKQIEHGTFQQVCIAQFILAFVAAFYIGPEPALQAEFYPTNIRNTSLSLSYNLATTIFGGTTPYVVSYIVLKTGSLKSASYYIFLCTALSLSALYFYNIRMQDDKKDNRKL
ncbi:MAG: proP1 [Rickettsiaceae bacterium]|jgi:MHS family proline/betaine transporter-like MFS transporter|nr:proP1 [Rickettsiaceae bacterium]